MKRCFLFVVLSLLLFSEAGPPAGADTPPRYRLTVLPLDFEGHNMIDLDAHRGGINAQGQVVGTVVVQKGSLRDSRIALWQKGRPLRMLDKRPVTHENVQSDQNFIYATAINAHGKVTGVETLESSGAYSIRTATACILWNGRLNRLYKGFPYADMASAALGLNDRGDVVGGFVYDNTTADQVDSSAPPGTENRHAFLRRGGHITSLWPGVARGINRRGWIVGLKDVDYENDRSEGILWREGHLTRLKLLPAAISERGEIAGDVPLTETTGSACVWRRGRLTVLSKQDSNAYALNNRGAVVGRFQTPASSHPARAALWKGGRTYDLNRCVTLPQNWVMQSALGIDDKGWIIGEGNIYRTPKDKQALRSFTFLLTPR